jgi:hypothetical protein
LSSVCVYKSLISYWEKKLASTGNCKPEYGFGEFGRPLSVFDMALGIPDKFERGN